MPQLKLYMLLLGCKPPGRHTEQHDVFFGIATSLYELVSEIKAFWPEPPKIHIDAWREVNYVDGYEVSIIEKPCGGDASAEGHPKLFFVNLGGYLENKFEEQHYVLLTVKNDIASATREAKETLFYQHNHFEGANSHIDDKYCIDVDDIYQIEDVLSLAQKAKYRIRLTRADEIKADEIHLGYLKMSTLESGRPLVSE